MIKKCLLGLGIIILGFVGFSNAGYSDVIVKPNGQLISQGQGGLKFQVSGKGYLLSQYLGLSRRVLAFAGGDEKVYFWWGKNSVPYMYYYYPGDNVNIQGFYSKYQVCDQLYSGSVEVTNCTTYNINTGSFYESLTPFFNSIKSTDYFGYSYGRYTIYTRVYYLRVCFSSAEYGQSVCFMSSDGINSSLGLDGDLSFGDLSQSVIYDPPGIYNYDPGDNTTFGSGNTDVIPSDIDSYISYYENNFGFDINMCYVGTDDLDSLYGASGIEFDYGSGATIYGLYHHIYSGFGSNKIHNVGSFVNVWLLNYASWFKTLDSERLYMAQYNGPDQNVTYIYSGFTFPFDNQPVAIYFMADLLSEEYITESSMGENIVFYCDMKLNYDNYKNGSLNFNDTENLVDNKIKERVKEYNNRTNPGQDGYSVPDLGSGSIWDGLVQSGYNIPADLNPTKLFKDFYSKIDNLFRNFNPAVSVGIIPLWILYPMLFLILFRIMRH